MARVSTRIGWSRHSAFMLVIVVLHGLMAGGLWIAHYRGLPLLFAVLAAVPLFFAFVHPGRVLETDDDDGPEVRVGDEADR